MEDSVAPPPPHPPIDEHRLALIQRKDRVFQEIVSEYPISVAKKLSNEERATMTCKTYTMIYGEVDFVSLAETFEVVKLLCGELEPGGLFVDLGSGTGKGVIAGALLHDFDECWGIELLSGLYGVSEQLKGTYDREFPRFMSEEPGLFSSKPSVRMINASFFDIDWSNASFIFSNSSVFSVEMLTKLGDVPIRPGTVAITTTKTLISPLWKVITSFKKKMSWGDATVIIQQRQADLPRQEEEVTERNPA